MAWWNRTPKKASLEEMGVEELLDKYNVVEVNSRGFVVVSEKPADQFSSGSGSPIQDVTTTELGYAGDTMYARVGQNDYNSDVRGWFGLRKWDEMRRGDGSVRGVLRLVKTPIYAARWFVEPASLSRQDVKIANFVEDALFRKMSVSWPQLLTEICLHLDFGYYAFEKVFTPDPGSKASRMIWQKWAPRHPLSVQNWEYDNHGGPLGCWAYSPTQEGGKVWLPIRKLLVFTNEKEAGNMEGLSILRSAYKHWFYLDNLYKIDAIQKERHGIGVPIIKLPPGFSVDDKAAATEIGENLRTNEKANIVLPPLWDVATLRLEGQPVDALVSAQHHVAMVYSSVMADFMTTSRPAPEKIDLFNKSTRFTADQIRDVINQWAIPELVDMNWKNVTSYPELKVRRIGETVDWQKISFAIRNLVGAGVIIPDDELEEWIRDEMDLPAADPASKRTQVTPQLPAPVAGGGTKGGNPPAGPPRQSTAGKSTQGKTAGGGKIGAPSNNNAQ